MCQAENFRLSEPAPLLWQHQAPRNYTQVFTHLDGPKALIRICTTPNCTFTLPKKSSWLPPHIRSALGQSQPRLIIQTFVRRRRSPVWVAMNDAKRRRIHACRFAVVHVVFRLWEGYALDVLQSSVYSGKLLRCNTSFGAHELACAWMVRELIYIVTFLTRLLWAMMWNLCVCVLVFN